ncbi:hypothetical protein [Marinibacterium profundimaris]|nr:hypothetical protein [Marinibacterium profundimaris]
MANVSKLLHEKHGVKRGTLSARLRRARPLLPRRIRHEADILREAEQLAENPRLAMTLSDPRYRRAADALTTHLKTIDVADRRKGYWLGVLGGMAFNLLIVLVLLFVTLALLGHI